VELAHIVLKYTEALVWPVLVFLAMCLFRGEIQELIRSLQRLRLPGGTEFEWEQTVSPLTPNEQRERRQKELPQAESNAFIAEELVLKMLEGETKTPVRRQVSFMGRVDLVFDGYTELHGRRIFVEVKYLTSADSVASIIDSVRSRVEEVREEGVGALVTGLLVFVVDATPAERRKIEEISKLESRRRSFMVRVVIFDKLKATFGVRESG